MTTIEKYVTHTHVFMAPEWDSNALVHQHAGGDKYHVHESEGGAEEQFRWYKGYPKEMNDAEDR